MRSKNFDVFALFPEYPHPSPLTPHPSPLTEIMTLFITTDLLDTVTAEAKASPRLRKNRNFHSSDEVVCHRLLNAIEPGSYIMPHRHLDPAKEETMIGLRGRLAVVLFDDSGAVAETAVLQPGGPALGVNIPVGTYHLVLALDTGTVFLEAKAGPYLPLTADEKAAWAPAEGEAGAAEYLARLAALFA